MHLSIKFGHARIVHLLSFVPIDSVEFIHILVTVLVEHLLEVLAIVFDALLFALLPHGSLFLLKTVLFLGSTVVISLFH
jgi:hypothetical protein